MGDNAWPIAPGLWRSLLLPGWGQLHQGRELAGYAWSSGFLLVALACGRQLHTAASQKDSYQKGSAAAVLLSPGLVSVLQKGTAIDAQSSGIQLLLLSAGNGSARQGQHMQAARGKRLVGALAALYTIAAIDTVVFRPDSRTAMSAGLSTDSLSFRISVSF